MRIKPIMLRAKFVHVATALGWDIVSPLWAAPANGKGPMLATVGRVFLHHDHGWEIVRFTTVGGGETTIFHGTAAEMVAWLSGAQLAAQLLSRPFDRNYP